MVGKHQHHAVATAAHRLKMLRHRPDAVVTAAPLLSLSMRMIRSPKPSSRVVAIRRRKIDHGWIHTSPAVAE